ncbi:hypothetical protein IE53DRAFT_369384 [Violaceomyces palustris]|uniref:Uncharacterized protein n=1 Tax=Violaceomyces palustris TaxID=1673888 RepID=A0ACD0NVT0_9BASI|nr:hypothetical protein IE53DRAFT_369384 [Violaceomyces palustris]
MDPSASPSSPACTTANLDLSVPSGVDHSVVLINGLPKGTELSLDNKTWILDSGFKGFKSLPKGLHCLSWSSPSSGPPRDGKGDEDGAGIGMGMGVSVKNSWLIDTTEGAKLFLRDYDPEKDDLVLPNPTPTASDLSLSRKGRASKKLRRPLNADERRKKLASTTLISQSHLESLQPQLVSFPSPDSLKESGEYEDWRNCIKYLDAKLRSSGGPSPGDGERFKGAQVEEEMSSNSEGSSLLARILGTDRSSGDYKTDSLEAVGKGRGSIEGLDEPGKDFGRTIWGKPRPPDEVVDQVMETKVYEADQRDDEEALQFDSEGLRFTDFDLKRSWPKGSVGEDLTRWSRDKSWLLEDVIRRSSTSAQGKPDASNLLAELELSWILFTQTHNYHALEQWKKLVTLFCRSHSFIGAPSTFEIHPSERRLVLLSNSGEISEGRRERESDAEMEELDGSSLIGARGSKRAKTSSNPGMFCQSNHGQEPYGTRVRRDEEQPEHRGSNPISSSTSGHIRRSLKPHSEFLRTLRHQLSLLRPEFWSQDSPELEPWIQAELKNLRSNIGRALSLSASRKAGETEGLVGIQGRREGGEEEKQEEEDFLNEDMVNAWRSLSQYCSKRFSWDLDEKLDEEAEVLEDEEAELGDDAPIIVEM